MSKLYPPYIEGSIPAFSDTGGGTVLTVPFSMNKAVSKSEVSGFTLAMKTIQQDKYLFQNVSNSLYDLEKCEATFNLSNYKSLLKVGQHYKIQIAYRDNSGQTGYYSTVGVVKYTSTPEVTIETLEKNAINQHTYSYIGAFNSEKDITEKVYTYKFTITDGENNIIYDTGFLIHNNSNDLNAYESFDEFTYSSDLEVNKVYYIRYTVRTNNNMILNSPKYKIVQRRSVSPAVDTKPILELNYDNGYVKVKLDPSNYIFTPVVGEPSVEEAVNGVFVLSRATNNLDWEEVYRFALSGDHLSAFEWKDFTVEQGKTYTYAIQQYNDYSLYSNRILSEPIYVDFEDAFLFDGIRQLKIKYNPKISSFKTDHLETKIDTIGSKYPFIFRNGNVAYKEFPISGLISYQSDEENLFINDNNLIDTKKITRKNQKEIDFDKIKTTNLTGINIAAERDFKLEVLDWLNNGQPKLFRSPSEGNYIVRLMNISLSPEDTLGRMLHTFNSTAYEIADFNYQHLNDYHFISIEEPDIQQMRWITIDLREKSSIQNNNGNNIELMQHNIATSIYLEGVMPGSKIYIDYYPIVIGSTGSYRIDPYTEIRSIQIPSNVSYSGLLTYSYIDSTKNTFNEYIDVKVNDIPARQFIGYHENILNQLEDIKFTIDNFYYLTFEKRSTSYAYAKWLGSRVEKDNGIVVLYRDAQYQKKINESYANNITDVFEDPLLVYNYHLEKIDFIIGNRLIVLEGFKEVIWPTNIYDKWIAQKEFKEELASNLNYYYIKENEQYVLADSEFNSDLTYYYKSPFDCYQDPFNPKIVYMSEDSYKQITEYEKDNKCIIDSIQLYTNKAFIDDNEIDVTDSGYYYVKSLADFETISLSAGISLLCGYTVQCVTYGEELSLSKYKTINSLLKLITNTTALDYGNSSFVQLCKDCGINSKLSYYDIILQAYSLLEKDYPKYIEELEEVLNEKSSIR